MPQSASVSEISDIEPVEDIHCVSPQPEGGYTDIMLTLASVGDQVCVLLELAGAKRTVSAVLDAGKLQALIEALEKCRDVMEA